MTDMDHGVDADQAANPQWAEFKRLVRTVAHAFQQWPPAANRPSRRQPCHNLLSANPSPKDQRPVCGLGDSEAGGNVRAVFVAVARLAAFLNALGTAAHKANYVDVQIYLQRRHAGRAPRESRSGDHPGTRSGRRPAGSVLVSRASDADVLLAEPHGYKGAWAFVTPKMRTRS